MRRGRATRSKSGSKVPKRQPENHKKPTQHISRPTSASSSPRMTPRSIHPSRTLNVGIDEPISHLSLSRSSSPIFSHHKRSLSTSSRGNNGRQSDDQNEHESQPNYFFKHDFSPDIDDAYREEKHKMKQRENTDALRRMLLHDDELPSINADEQQKSLQHLIGDIDNAERIDNYDYDQPKVDILNILESLDPKDTLTQMGIRNPERTMRTLAQIEKSKARLSRYSSHPEGRGSITSLPGESKDHVIIDNDDDYYKPDDGDNDTTTPVPSLHATIPKRKAPANHRRNEKRPSLSVEYLDDDDNDGNDDHGDDNDDELDPSNDPLLYVVRDDENEYIIPAGATTAQLVDLGLPPHEIIKYARKQAQDGYNKVDYANVNWKAINLQLQLAKLKKEQAGQDADFDMKPPKTPTLDDFDLSQYTPEDAADIIEYVNHFEHLRKLQKIVKPRDDPRYKELDPQWQYDPAQDGISDSELQQHQNKRQKRLKMGDEYMDDITDDVIKRNKRLHDGTHIDNDNDEHLQRYVDESKDILLLDNMPYRIMTDNDDDPNDIEGGVSGAHYDKYRPGEYEYDPLNDNDDDTGDIPATGRRKSMVRQSQYPEDKPTVKAMKVFSRTVPLDEPLPKELQRRVNLLLTDANYLKKKDLHFMMNDMETWYIANRLPVVYSVLRRVLIEIRQRIPAYKPESVLEFAAGASPALWASRDVYYQDVAEYTSIERDGRLALLGQQLTADLGIHIFYRPKLLVAEDGTAQLSDANQSKRDKKRTKLRFKDRKAMDKEDAERKAKHAEMLSKKHQLVVAPYAISKQPNKEYRQLLIDALWDQVDPQGGLLLLLESTEADASGFNIIREARDYLLKKHPKVTIESEPVTPLVHVEEKIANETTDMPEWAQNATKKVTTGTSSNDSKTGPPASSILPCSHDRPCPMGTMLKLHNEVKRLKQIAHEEQLSLSLPQVPIKSCMFGQRMLRAPMPNQSPIQDIQVPGHLGDAVIENFSYIVLRRGELPIVQEEDLEHTVYEPLVKAPVRPPGGLDPNEAFAMARNMREEEEARTRAYKRGESFDPDVYWAQREREAALAATAGSDGESSFGEDYDPDDNTNDLHDTEARRLALNIFGAKSIDNVESIESFNEKMSTQLIKRHVSITPPSPSVPLTKYDKLNAQVEREIANETEKNSNKNNKKGGKKGNNKNILLSMDDDNTANNIDNTLGIDPERDILDDYDLDVIEAELGYKLDAEGLQSLREAIIDMEREKPLINPKREFNLNRWSRVISPPLKRGGHVVMDLCTPDGNFERRVVGRQSVNVKGYNQARHTKWGDVWAYKRPITLTELREERKAQEENENGTSNVSTSREASMKLKELKALFSPLLSAEEYTAAGLSKFAALNDNNNNHDDAHITDNDLDQYINVLNSKQLDQLELALLARNTVKERERLQNPDSITKKQQHEHDMDDTYSDKRSVYHDRNVADHPGYYDAINQHSDYDPDDEIDREDYINDAQDTLKQLDSMLKTGEISLQEHKQLRKQMLGDEYDSNTHNKDDDITIITKTSLSGRTNAEKQLAVVSQRLADLRAIRRKKNRDLKKAEKRLENDNFKDMFDESVRTNVDIDDSLLSFQKEQMKQKQALQAQSNTLGDDYDEEDALNDALLQRLMQHKQRQNEEAQKLNGGVITQQQQHQDGDNTNVESPSLSVDQQINLFADETENKWATSIHGQQHDALKASLLDIVSRDELPKEVMDKLVKGSKPRSNRSKNDGVGTTPDTITTQSYNDNDDDTSSNNKKKNKKLTPKERALKNKLDQYEFSDETEYEGEDTIFKQLQGDINNEQKKYDLEEKRIRTEANKQKKEARQAMEQARKDAASAAAAAEQSEEQESSAQYSNDDDNDNNEPRGPTIIRAGAMDAVDRSFRIQSKIEKLRTQSPWTGKRTFVEPERYTEENKERHNKDHQQPQSQSHQHNKNQKSNHQQQSQHQQQQRQSFAPTKIGTNVIDIGPDGKLVKTPNINTFRSAGGNNNNNSSRKQPQQRRRFSTISSSFITSLSMRSRQFSTLLRTAASGASSSSLGGDDNDSILSSIARHAASISNRLFTASAAAAVAPSATTTSRTTRMTRGSTLRPKGLSSSSPSTTTTTQPPPSPSSLLSSNRAALDEQIRKTASLQEARRTGKASNDLSSEYTVEPVVTPKQATMLVMPTKDSKNSKLGQHVKTVQFTQRVPPKLAPNGTPIPSAENQRQANRAIHARQTPSITTAVVDQDPEADYEIQWMSPHELTRTALSRGNLDQTRSISDMNIFKYDGVMGPTSNTAMSQSATLAQKFKTMAKEHGAVQPDMATMNQPQLSFTKIEPEERRRLEAQVKADRLEERARVQADAEHAIDTLNNVMTASPEHTKKRDTQYDDGLFKRDGPITMTAEEALMEAQKAPDYLFTEYATDLLSVVQTENSTRYDEFGQELQGKIGTSMPDLPTERLRAASDTARRRAKQRAKRLEFGMRIEHGRKNIAYTTETPYLPRGGSFNDTSRTKGPVLISDALGPEAMGKTALEIHQVQDDIQLVKKIRRERQRALLTPLALSENAFDPTLPQTEKALPSVWAKTVTEKRASLAVIESQEEAEVRHEREEQGLDYSHTAYLTNKDGFGPKMDPVTGRLPEKETTTPFANDMITLGELISLEKYADPQDKPRFTAMIEQARSMAITNTGIPLRIKLDKHVPVHNDKDVQKMIGSSRQQQQQKSTFSYRIEPIPQQELALIEMEQNKDDTVSVRRDIQHALSSSSLAPPPKQFKSLAQRFTQLAKKQEDRALLYGDSDEDNQFVPITVPSMNDAWNVKQRPEDFPQQATRAMNHFKIQERTYDRIRAEMEEADFLERLSGKAMKFPMAKPEDSPFHPGTSSSGNKVIPTSNKIKREGTLELDELKQALEFEREMQDAYDTTYGAAKRDLKTKVRTMAASAGIDRETYKHSVKQNMSPHAMANDMMDNHIFIDYNNNKHNEYDDPSQFTEAQVVKTSKKKTRF